MTKFQGKLASLQQVSNPNSQDNFQICCADLYLVRFLANFVGFRVFFVNFADLLEFHGSATARNIRRPVKTIKIMTILTIFYAYCNRSFSQNLNLWLLEKSEMINLQMLIQKNTFNVLSSNSPFEKTCSAMSASVSLARTPFWNMRKPAGI